MNRIFGFLTAATLLVALCSDVRACGLHPRDPDKIRFRSTPVDAPDPFDPQTQTSTLTVQTAVRRTEGLGRDERHFDPNDHRRFFVRAIWKIFSGSRPVATIEKETEVVPPFRFVELEASRGRGRKTFIMVPDMALVWDGRSTGSDGGVVQNDGVYAYTVEAEFVRVTRTRKGVIEKEIDDTQTVGGSMTIHRVIPLSLSITSPADGTITRESTVNVSGSMEGEPPLAVSVNGTAAPISGGTFSVQQAVVEGGTTITVVATDGIGGRIEKTVAIIRDSVSPVISAVSPANGSLLTTGSAVVAVTYSDPTPGSGIENSSFSAFLDQQDVSSSFTVGPDGARGSFVDGSRLTEGPHVFRLSIRDRAGNLAEVSSSVTVDSIAPSIALTPWQGTTITVSTPSLVATYVDPSPGSGLALGTFRATLDGADVTSAFAAGSMQASYQVPPTSPLGEGEHTLACSISDQAGNSNTASSVFLLDTRPPSLTVIAPPQGATVGTTTPRFEVAFEDPMPGSGLAQTSFRAELDARDITAEFTLSVNGAIYDVPPATGLSPGPHSLRLEISDKAGHVVSTQGNFQIIPGEGPPVRVAKSGFATGLVLDGTTGQPLAGVKVTIKGVPGVLSVNGDGRCVFPTLSSGTYLMTFQKEGYTVGQRWVKVAEGRDSAIKPVRLIPLDAKKTFVRAAEGGVVTDSTDRISLTIPPGGLPEDMELQVTDLPNSSVLPNELPGQSQYLSCFSVSPSIRCSVPVRVTYRLKTSVPFIQGEVLPVGHYDCEAGAWTSVGTARVTTDGHTVETEVSEFSAIDINPSTGRYEHPPAADWNQEQTARTEGDAPSCQNVGSAVLPGNGSFLEDHVLPGASSLRRPTRLIYSSRTADAHPLLRFQTSISPWARQPANTRFEVTIGTAFQEWFYTAPQDRATYRYLWDALDRDGEKVPTGSYPYLVRLSNDYTDLPYGRGTIFGEPALSPLSGPTTLEPVPVRMVARGRIPVLNRRKSPFGAGWGLDGLSRLHFDPDGHILAEDGNGRATVFSPSELIYGPQYDSDANETWAKTFDKYVVVDSATQTIITTFRIPNDQMDPRAAQIMRRVSAIHLDTDSDLGGPDECFHRANTSAAKRSGFRRIQYAAPAFLRCAFK